MRAQWARTVPGLSVQFYAYAQSCLTLLWPLEQARLLCAWDSPGKNTGVDCHFLLQGEDPLLSTGLDFSFITPFSALAFSQVGQLLWLQMVVVGLERPKLQLVASQSPSAHSHAQCALASQDSPWIKHIPRLLLVETRPSPNQELLA